MRKVCQQLEVVEALRVFIGSQPVDVRTVNTGIDPCDGGTKQVRENIGLFIPGGILEGKVAVAKPHQMQNAGDFDP